MHRRQAHSKRNNRLNVLVAGSGGCGKSTLINALCNGHEVTNVVEWLDTPATQANQPRPLRLRTYTEDMSDSDFGSVTLRLVETQGLGDNLTNREHIDAIVKYVEGQFDEVLAEESRIRRNPRFTDSRVHAVIYMIEATGHGLREQDVLFMQQVAEVANVIPVLAKSDALTPAEVLTNKRLVYEDIEHYKIPIYQFYNDGDRQQYGSPQSGMDDYEFGSNHEDEEDMPESRRAHYQAMRKLQESLPFAVVASSKAVNTANTGQVALIRQYPWGVVNIEDPKVSDFSTLKDVLLYSHMEDLKETTNDILYERYRTQRLSGDPAFNAATSAASAPITASRANLAGAAQRPVVPQAYDAAGIKGYQGPPIAGPNSGYASAMGSRNVSNSSGHNQEYMYRENRLIEEEQLLHRDEKLVQSELELRRQELQRRELELKRLEERLRQDSHRINQSSVL